MPLKTTYWCKKTVMTVRDCNSFADDVVKTFQMTPDASMLESETGKTGDECETKENVEDVFSITRNVRVATNGRISKYR